MMDDLNSRSVYRFFAEILAYPTPTLPLSIGDCMEHVEGCCPEAAPDLQAFLALVEREGLERMQEIYTRTFDIAPVANLYVGYHLFGESFKRGAFLAKLMEAYQSSGFATGPELADHLSVVLRFASVAEDAEFVIPLLEEGVMPALDKVVDALKASTEGYAPAINSLRSFLRQHYPKSVATGGL